MNTAELIQKLITRNCTIKGLMILLTEALPLVKLAESIENADPYSGEPGPTPLADRIRVAIGEVMREESK